MEEVEPEADRLEEAGLALRVEGDVVCCYARQDKHWVTGPDGQQWENYVVLADAGAELEGRTRADLALERADDAAAGGCCAGFENADTAETTEQSRARASGPPAADPLGATAKERSRARAPCQPRRGGRAHLANSTIAVSGPLAPPRRPGRP